MHFSGASERDAIGLIVDRVSSRDRMLAGDQSWLMFPFGHSDRRDCNQTIALGRHRSMFPVLAHTKGLEYDPELLGISIFLCSLD